LAEPTSIIIPKDPEDLLALIKVRGKSIDRRRAALEADSAIMQRLFVAAHKLGVPKAHIADARGLKTDQYVRQTVREWESDGRHKP
jgi:hypothetical protein